MRSNLPSQLHSAWRLLVVPALAFAVLALMPFMTGLQGVFPSSLAAAGVAISESDASLRARPSTSPYKWNLSDDGLPLISFPDHIGGGVDLSLTYSMDQFQFPLFQSLYYNQRAGKYILMVMTEQGSAEFADLSAKEGVGHFQFRNNSKLLWSVTGNSRLISTSDGTVYAFVKFGDGELHCSQIKDRTGRAIDLKYTDAASLARISDPSGRTVDFGYTGQYLSSITQTWGPKNAQRKKTWAIDNDAVVNVPAVKFAHARPAFAHAGPVTAKRIPTNATKPTYTRAMAASDSTLASLFGGSGAMAAANGYEPVGLGSQYPLYRGDFVGDDGVVRRGHLSYAMHLYGSPDGRGEMGVYVPHGFISHSSEPTPTDAAVSFYYPRLGNLTDVTLVVFHVANFQLTRQGNRVRIGDIGGRGGSIASYKHAHLEFYRGNTGLPPNAARSRLRIDPATVFGSPPTAAR